MIFVWCALDEALFPHSLFHTVGNSVKANLATRNFSLGPFLLFFKKLCFFVPVMYYLAKTPWKVSVSAAKDFSYPVFFRSVFCVPGTAPFPYATGISCIFLCVFFFPAST